jgi:hypothetical protein
VRIPAGERENFRLNKGNIFPSRKSLVSDIPAGEGKTAKHFFTVCYRLTKILFDRTEYTEWEIIFTCAYMKGGGGGGSASVWNSRLSLKCRNLYSPSATEVQYYIAKYLLLAMGLRCKCAESSIPGNSLHACVPLYKLCLYTYLDRYPSRSKCSF